MSEYQPTPYIAALKARADALRGLARPLSAEEKREARSIAKRLHEAEWHWTRYRSDPAFRETRKARARDYWREHPQREGVSR